MLGLVAAAVVIRHTESNDEASTGFPGSAESGWGQPGICQGANMGRTLELGRRIELKSMDPHCHDISLGLYRQETAQGAAYLVHTYSAHPEGSGRVAEITSGLVKGSGMVPLDEDPGLVAFPCGGRHEKALRRTFLEVCKLTGAEMVGVQSLVRPDKKAECELTIESLGGGSYRITAPADAELGPRRCQAVSRGFAKLCEMELDESQPDVVRFGCGQEHDALMGAMFFRAQNVRSAMKEDELTASRGMLAAPGSQDANQ